MLKLDKQVYRTFKVVNNNIVIVKDSNGREMIAIGKGLGFKKSKNDIVYPEEIMKTYIYLDRQKNLNLTLFEEVPFEVIEVSQHIIDYAAKTLNQNIMSTYLSVFRIILISVLNNSEREIIPQSCLMKRLRDFTKMSTK